VMEPAGIPWYRAFNTKLHASAAAQLAMVLVLFARCGLVHNDLHGGNVLVMPRQEPRVLRYVVADNTVVVVRATHFVSVIDYGQMIVMPHSNVTGPTMRIHGGVPVRPETGATFWTEDRYSMYQRAMPERVRDMAFFLQQFVPRKLSQSVVARLEASTATFDTAAELVGVCRTMAAHEPSGAVQVVPVVPNADAWLAQLGADAKEDVFDLRLSGAQLHRRIRPFMVAHYANHPSAAIRKDMAEHSRFV